jgi:hypothetical protein
MLDKQTAHRNLVLALKLGIFALVLFASALLIGVLVRYA